MRYGLQDSVVVLPDFFMDRIVKFDSKSQFLDVINYKTRLGGGSIRGIQTFDIKGGNAANVAYCLAKFGLPVTLFTIANEIGSSVLQKIFSKFEKNADLRIANGKHGVTTSLEFKDENSISNIMMSDIGDIETFGPDKINHEEDLKKIFSAKCVILTNWASNLKGTELAKHVFRNSPNALHFIDPADIDVRRDEFKDALNVISEVTDVLSINENECDSLTRALGFGSILSSEPTNTDLIKKAARIISDKFGIEVDLHTRTGAAWSNGKEVSFEAAFNVHVHTMTGSGDCWDAADVVGHLAGLDPNERLLLSNACSALYIQNESFESPTMDELIQFLKNSYKYR
jgi:ribokinase